MNKYQIDGVMNFILDYLSSIKEILLTTLFSLIGYYFFYKNNNAKKKIRHDIRLFQDIDKLITPSEIEHLIYFSKNCEQLIKVNWDELNQFINQAPNEFISEKKLNSLLKKYNDCLSDLVNWYVHNAEQYNDGFRLIVSDFDPEKETKLNQCGKLTFDLEEAYTQFRIAVKEKLNYFDH